MKRIGLLTFAASALVTSIRADINKPDFSDVSDLKLNGNASQQGNTLQLTPSAAGQSGSAFSLSTVALNNSSSFSTKFQFQITSPGGIGDGDGQGADGIVFAVQTQSNSVGGAGGGIGYQNISPSVGIEFDTYDNGLGVGDPNGNHAGVDLNGNIFSVATALEPTRFNDGKVWTAWVDYDGATDLIEVRYNETGIRPASANLSYTVDLALDLGSPNAYVGFTAGTGSGYGDHRILSWELRTDFKPIDIPGDGVPDGGSSFALLSLASVAMLGWAKKARG